MVAEVHTKGRFGRQTKSIRVESNDPAEPVVALTLTFVSQTPVEVFPDRSLTLQGVQGDAIAAELIVRRSDGQPLTITGAASTRPGVTVTSTQLAAPRPADGRTPEARPGDWRVAVSLDANDAVRSENGEIRITTDHPELPALSIPLLVRVRSLVDVLPPRISVAHVAGSAPSVARVTLRHGALKRFHVTDAKVLGAPGVSARVISEQPAAMQVIEITLPDGALASGAHAAELVVSTNLAKRLPEIRVPIAIRVTAKPNANGVASGS